MRTNNIELLFIFNRSIYASKINILYLPLLKHTLHIKNVIANVLRIKLYIITPKGTSFKIIKRLIEH